MSLKDFAAHLGVGERLISKWEAGAKGIIPRPVNQAALDTSFARLDPESRARFKELVSVDVLADTRDPDVPESGSHRQHPGDGKVMVWIAEGIYLSGYQSEPQWLDGYWIDVFPTTNRDYALFVTATDYPAPQHWGAELPAREMADHPVVWVSWEDAQAYSRWAGKALPTASQWEKAARGTRGNPYPWGVAPTPAKCNVRGSGPGRTTSVDTYKSGVSPYGVFDMCGNTWEWMDTPTTETRRELKGSAFTSHFDRVHPAAFNDAHVAMVDDDTGFRCVAVELS
ncbi:SUMF1/EgtB/PvdO family nonheme iron enzyme [Nocardia sp. NPDC060259]|uniref:SUMF1/EgtB/PvdO family nonheme iron enzyme n=1 Tax=Nocardia sp. NPDC060259 TaxID=3347088 RepID=UPI00364D8CB7